MYNYQINLIQKNTINENNWESVELEPISIRTNPSEKRMNNAANLYYSQNGDKLYLRLYTYRNEDVFPIPVLLSELDFENNDLLIVRRNFNRLATTQATLGIIDDLFMVIRNMEDATINLNAIELSINHYKIN